MPTTYRLRAPSGAIRHTRDATVAAQASRAGHRVTAHTEDTE